MNTLININYKLRKKEINSVLKKLEDLLLELDDRENLKDLKKISEGLDKPFMFVIIGEVKSGKSSFINALLEERELCKTDVSICTDKITQLLYSEEEYEKLIDDDLVEIGTNKEILKEISIVDTPGTNSMVTNHEKITRSFVPESDLIIFVFPVYNPHQKSAWEVLEYINKGWKKNVIFVCQQSDRSTGDEIRINRDEVRKYAIERGIADPRIFITSAKLAMEEGDQGVEELREFISEHVTDGKHIRNKLSDKIKGTEIIRDRIVEKLESREETLKTDRKLRERIKTSFEAGEKRSEVEIDNIIGRLLKIYLHREKVYTRELEEKLSPGNLFKQVIPGIRKERIGREEMEAFLKSMKNDLQRELEEEAKKNAAHFIGGVKEIFNRVIAQVNYEMESGSRDKIYDDFYQKREEVFHSTKERLEELADEEKFLDIIHENLPDVGNIALKGGVITIAGTLLALLTQNAYLDMTGGILAAAGILGTTLTIMFKRNRIIKEFREGMEKGGEEFKENLELQLKNTLNILYEEIDRIFIGFDEHIEKEEKGLVPLRDKLERAGTEIIHIKNELK